MESTAERVLGQLGVQRLHTSYFPHITSVISAGSL